MSEYKAKPPKDFGRKFSGRGILLVMFVLLILCVGATEIFRQIRWNAAMNKIEPRESWTEIAKNLRAFYKQNKRFPQTLAEAENNRWKWASAPVVTKTGLSRDGVKTVSRVRFRQYEYLYAQLNAQTAVMWAVPIWTTSYQEPWFINLYTGHNEEFPTWIDIWRKEKKTWFVVFFEKDTKIYRGVIPPQSNATAGLEANLEPSVEWLKARGLFEGEESWKK